MTKRPPLNCSFCGRLQTEVRHLVASSVLTCICDECVELAAVSIGRRLAPAETTPEQVRAAVGASITLIDDTIAKAVAVRADLQAWADRLDAAPAAG